MEAEQIARVQARLTLINQLLGALQTVWPQLEAHLVERKDRFTKQLVAANNEEIRGRIKELSELMELPTRLHREAVDLQRTTD